MSTKKSLKQELSNNQESQLVSVVENIVWYIIGTENTQLKPHSAILLDQNF